MSAAARLEPAALQAAQQAPSDGRSAALLFLAAAVLIVPLAKRLGLGAFLGYLLAGMAIGPWGLGFVRDPEAILHGAEFGVVLAEDGFDALAKINDHLPNVVFCDILMPRLDGYQTCALIKKNPKFASTPVIMLSSKDGLFDRARGRMVGSDEYLTKPFTKDSLIKTVADHAARG